MPEVNRFARLLRSHTFGREEARGRHRPELRLAVLTDADNTRPAVVALLAEVAKYGPRRCVPGLINAIRPTASTPEFQHAEP